MDSPVLPRSIYERSPQEAARALLGCRLVRWLDGERAAGLIVECEAYDGETDLACHARAGLTERTRVMYGAPGHAYIYFTYGVHWMLNAVTGPVGYPAAVLVRAVVPVEGLEALTRRRPLPARLKYEDYPAPLRASAPAGWTDGPAKLCQALEITGDLNGQDLCDPEGGLWIEQGPALPDDAVSAGPRVGIGYAPEPWRSMAWRYRVRPATREKSKE